jgi:hypothetical protein
MYGTTPALKLHTAYSSSFNPSPIADKENDAAQHKIETQTLNLSSFPTTKWATFNQRYLPRTWSFLKVSKKK